MIGEHAMHKQYKFTATIANLMHYRICDIINKKKAIWETL